MIPSIRMAHATTSPPVSPEDVILTAPIGIYRSRLDGTIDYANPALARILGYANSADLATHRMPDFYLDPAERDRLIEQWKLSGELADLQVCWKRKDGTPVWVTLTAHGVKDGSGHTQYFQGFVRDATRERAQQDLLRMSEERLRTVIEATHHAVWDWDLATDMILWGDGFPTLFGYESPEERTAIDAWRKRVHPDDVERVSTGLRRAITEGRTVWEDEYRFRRAEGGWAVVADRGRVLRDEHGEPIRVIGAMRDVTEQRQAEDQLRHAQKMEAVGQLTGGIAHDFNNLLTVILANADLLESAIPSDVEVESELRDIQSAARRGQIMVRKLLGFARRTTLELRQEELSTLVDDAGSMLRRLIPETISIEVRHGGGPHDITADAGAVEQILVNLTTNARDAMPDGGTLVISVHRTYVFDIPEHTEGARPGSYVCLTVSDSGQGLDVETQARMFEPFFTTKSPDRGTGLGLAMVYGLVRQHDGFVQVTSAPGEGTSVRVFFPATRGEAPARRTSPTHLGTQPSGGGLVLVAEDEEEVRSASRRALERLGYEVVTAEDGESALALYRERAADIRLVLSDVVMPRRNGPSLFRAIRGMGGDVPVLFASGYPARDLEAAATLPPDVPLLRKPWTVEELAQAVRGAIEGATDGT